MGKTLSTTIGTDILAQNIMKVEKLMIGDWIIIPMSNAPVKIASVNGDGVTVYNEDDYTEYPYYIGEIKPIQLTPEILEKNGFTKYDVGHNVKGWAIMDEEYRSDIPFTLTDNDFDTKQGEYKWGPVEDDREESFVREIGRINYVHELQHLLKLCGIEKEIVL